MVKDLGVEGHMAPPLSWLRRCENMCMYMYMYLYMYIGCMG